MTEKQIKEYERLSKLKDQYEKFLEKDGNVGISYYSSTFKEMFCATVDDDDFKSTVRELAGIRLEQIKKEIELL